MYCLSILPSTTKNLNRSWWRPGFLWTRTWSNSIDLMNWGEDKRERGKESQRTEFSCNFEFGSASSTRHQAWFDFQHQQSEEIRSWSCHWKDSYLFWPPRTSLLSRPLPRVHENEKISYEARDFRMLWALRDWNTRTSRASRRAHATIPGHIELHSEVRSWRQDIAPCSRKLVARIFHCREMWNFVSHSWLWTWLSKSRNYCDDSRAWHRDIWNMLSWDPRACSHEPIHCTDKDTIFRSRICKSRESSHENVVYDRPRHVSECQYSAPEAWYRCCSLWSLLRKLLEEDVSGRDRSSYLWCLSFGVRCLRM